MRSDIQMRFSSQPCSPMMTYLDSQWPDLLSQGVTRNTLLHDEIHWSWAEGHALIVSVIEVVGH